MKNILQFHLPQKEIELDQKRELDDYEMFAFVAKSHKIYFDTMNCAKSAFRTNKWINIATVLVGIALLANSIAYTWIHHTADLWSYFSGGIGISSFIVIFFTKPQEMLARATGNLAQFRMISEASESQWDFLRTYSKLMLKPLEKEQNSTRLAKEVLELFKQTGVATNQYAQEIQRHIEDSSGSKQSEDSSGSKQSEDKKKAPV